LGERKREGGRREKKEIERGVLGVNNWYQNNVHQSDLYGPKRTNQFVAGNANPRLTSEIASRK